VLYVLKAKAKFNIDRFKKKEKLNKTKSKEFEPKNDKEKLND